MPSPLANIARPNSRSKRKRVAALVAATAIGATVVVTQVASGAGTGTESVFVPITPCRLLDTRPTADNVGPRSTKIGNGETAAFTAWGTGDGDSPCDVPNSATAIATNTVVLAPTARGFLTLFPGDVTNPGTANLNFVAGQAPTPNSANIPLSATGTFNVFNAFGEVHVVIDVNGYYQPSSAVGSQGPQGDPGPQGTPGNTGSPGAPGEPGTGRPTYGNPVANYTARISGSYNAAITTDTFGMPVLSHQSGSTLFIDRCTSINCLTSTQQTVADVKARPTSVRTMSSGKRENVAVLYEQNSTDDVRVARCSFSSCSTSLIQTDSTLGSNSAMTLNSLSFPMTVSRTMTGVLVMTSCLDSECSSLSSVDFGSSNGGASITTDGSGRPVISHYPPGSLEVIVCDNEACANPTRNTITNVLGSRSTIKIGSDGNPRVVYEIARLLGSSGTNLATCADPVCAVSARRIIADPAIGASLVIMPDGRPVITTATIGVDTQLAHICDDTACTTDTDILLQTASPASSTTLTLGPTGNPLFAMDLEGDLGIGAISWPSWSPNIGES